MTKVLAVSVAFAFSGVIRVMIRVSIRVSFRNTSMVRFSIRARLSITVMARSVLVLESGLAIWLSFCLELGSHFWLGLELN